MTTVTDEQVELRAGPATVLLGKGDEGMLLQHIEVDDDGGHIAHHFDPGLPADWSSLRADYETEVAFSIDIDDQQDVLTGSVSVTREEDGEATLLLQLETPEWAQRNPMEVHLELTDDGHRISSRTIPDG